MSDKIVTIQVAPEETILRLRHENLDLAHQVSYLTERAIRVVDLFDFADGNALILDGGSSRELQVAVDELRELLARLGTPPALMKIMRRAE